jgi:hypothetical protein
MSFLTLSNDIITISEDVINVDVISKLRNKYKVESELQKVLKFVYHSYKKEHSFNNLSITERKDKVMQFYLNGDSCKKYDEDKIIQNFVKFYVSLEYTQNEWLYQKLKIDIEDIKAHINDIPMNKIVKFDEDVTIEFETPCGEEGKMIKVRKLVNIKLTRDIDNSKERMEALKRIVSLQEMEEKFREIIARERKMKEHNKELSLLEGDFWKDNVI